jgi:hypothetical protein
MENVLTFHPRKLRAVLDGIARAFSCRASSPSRSPTRARRIYLRAPRPGRRRDHDFARAIPGGDLDALLLLLPDAADSDLACIQRILAVRSSRRLLDLYWPLFQFHFENRNVVETAKFLLDSLDSKSRENQSADNLALFVSGEGVADFFSELDAEPVPFGIFALRKKLILKSPLGISFMEQFFLQCGKDGYLLNTKRLLQVFDSVPPESAEKILVNYLRQLGREEYIFEINMYILERWGAPFRSADWTGIPMELRRKFADWNSYRLLMLHFTRNMQKLRTLNRVIPYILHIRLENENRFMAADFGDFVIVDDNELSSYSYLLKKNYYESLSDRITNYGADGIKFSADRVPGARNFILDETEENFMQLEYNEVGKLYIMDMLRILLGIDPDLRPSKSIVRKKRQAGHI